MAQDSVAEDVEHVVTVVCEGERMDERIEMNDAEAERDGEEGPSKSTRSRQGRRESRDDGRQKEGEGEEDYERP